VSGQLGGIRNVVQILPKRQLHL